MNACIISVGTELVLGRTVDTNSAWLAARLAEAGVRTTQHRTVGDDRDDIVRAIRDACRSADVALVTGGLGPTDDDLTRQALADVMVCPLETRPELVEQLRAFFAARRREMPAANLVQACVPRGAQPIENRWGTAPGLRAHVGQADVFCMPGVPSEMQAMYSHEVRPVIEALSAGAVIVETVVQTYGGAEAEIGERIADLMQRGRMPEVGTTAKDAIIGIRVTAAGRSREQAMRLIEADVAEIRRRLGTWVLGIDTATLEGDVGRLLVDREMTVATAESCTGGLIAKRLTDVAGSSRYFLAGMVTYSNAAKQRELGVPGELLAKYGAVSAEVAAAMARGCREKTGADFALSATGIAGPDGGTATKPVGLVYIGLAHSAGVVTRELRIGNHLVRAAIRDRATKSALNLLRLHLLETGASVAG